ncbi:hypothetical protein Pmani_020888 [Petrolisthes manimaculis]|uniref:Caspase family p10 domain-containing protein n=1 Tax=Petrolisthes manimaculis TaxID=1843537 RepID=A0AAE1U632_9EUCA|nr:hypothetical protein Pmani_020888 [Petrolisthes manimaculis]
MLNSGLYLICHNTRSSDASSVCENSMTSDSSDTRWIGKGIPVQDKYNNRPQAATPVDSHSLKYRMNHKRRGLALIIVYEEYGGSGPLACRGDETDKGIQLNKQKGLRVSTDSFDPREKEDYVIPIHADMLMMWASYPGMFAFNSNNFGVKGSVFIHFLCQLLLENSFHDDLATLLLRVTREVAIKYESYVPDNSNWHSKKQIPYTVSTLMRKVYFFEK